MFYRKHREGLVIHEHPDEEDEEAEAETAPASPMEKPVSLKEMGGRHPRLVFYDLSASGA